MVPEVEGTEAIAERTCFIDGDAKMSPHATAERRPVPTVSGDVLVWLFSDKLKSGESIL